MQQRGWRFWVALPVGLTMVLAFWAGQSAALAPEAFPAIPPTPPRPDGLSLSSCSDIPNAQCAQTRPGLSLCRLNNVCVVQIDLHASALVPRVVIAPGGGAEWLSTMAGGIGAIAAINGDYFSGCPDPVPPYNCGEGLTFVDGEDYTDYTGNEWQNRRSLGFNGDYEPNIDWPAGQDGYHWQTLGGGPQVTFGGEYRWRCWYQDFNTEGDCWCEGNVVVINGELFGCSAANWWKRPHSFIGFSEDRHTLYLAASEPGYDKTPHEMHDVLWVYGARYTLKLDGGGSSGLYFNDGAYAFAWNGQRAVANAWAIVPYIPPPHGWRIYLPLIVRLTSVHNSFWHEWRPELPAWDGRKRPSRSGLSAWRDRPGAAVKVCAGFMNGCQS